MFGNYDRDTFAVLQGGGVIVGIEKTLLEVQKQVARVGSFRFRTAFVQNAQTGGKRKVLLFAAQLNLRQAFDSAKHSAIVRALEEKKTDLRISGAIARLLARQHN